MPATLYAEDFRLGGYDDLDTLTDAFIAWVSQGGELYLEPGYTYDLGDYTTANGTVFTLSGIEDAILAGNGATIVINTDDTIAYNLFLLTNARRVHFRDLSVKDTGFDPSVQHVGAHLFSIDGNYENVQTQDISFDNVHADGGLTFIQTKGTGDPEEMRITGVHIVPNCSARNCFYGLNCVENGDNITGGFYAFRTKRAYFPYGVSNHDLSLIVEDDGDGPNAETNCIIVSKARPTRNIKLKVLFRGRFDLSPNQSTPGCFVKLEMQPTVTGAGRIDNIDLNIDLDEDLVNTHNAHVLGFRSYTQTPTEETSTTDNIWSNIRLDGTFRNKSAQNIKAYVVPNTPCLISFAPGLTGAQTFHLPKERGFLFRTAENSEFQLRRGNLTTGPIGPIPIDLSGVNFSAFTIKVKTYVHDKESTLFWQKSVYREDIITGYNSNGVVIQATGSCFTPVAQSTPPTVTFVANGQAIDVTIAGGDYDESDSFARVEVEYIAHSKFAGG